MELSGAKSNRINPEDRTEIEYVLTEHDLEYPLDYRESEEDLFPAKINAASVVSHGIALRLEKLAADLVQDLNSYPVDNKITLSSSDKFVNPDSIPFVIFNNAVEAVRRKIAVRPNVCVIGASVFASLKEHPAVLDRIKYTQHAVITIDLLKALLNFEQLYVGDAVYVDDAGNQPDIWSDNVILAYIPPQNSDISRSYYEPSFSYTLRKKNKPVMDSYDEQGKVLIVRNTDIFIPKIVGADAGT